MNEKFLLPINLELLDGIGWLMTIVPLELIIEAKLWDDIKENKRVVLKVFKSTWREVRIKGEILAMKGLDHPEIIKLLDYHLAEDKDDYSYLVMDEIE